MTDFISKNLSNLIRVKKNEAFRHLEIIEDYHRTGQKYIDQEFPPDETSLIRRMETPAKWRNYVWRRAPEFMGNNVNVFDSIDPNDIKQGGLGDCYFLSCLAALAERPLLIQRLFLTEHPNEAGCYAMWLNDNGEWKNFIVDDYFPCSSRNSGAVFSRGNGPELWVLLLEKAYAKLHGSYDIIEGGDPAWALRDLTGAPWDFLDSENPDEIWNYVKSSDDKGYLLTCYTKSTEIREEQNDLGIVYGHAYSILDAKQVVTDYGAERLIRIRNPWGKFEWQGDWGDNSDKWTENVKSQVNYENKDDGTFWMSVNDFVRFYQGVGICKLHENYLYKSINFDHKASGKTKSIFRLVVPQATHIFLSVNQKDDRGFDPQTFPYEYSTVRMMVGRVEQNGLSYVGGKFYNDRNVVLECNLEAGYYIITLEFYWRQNFYQQANINAYSEKKVHFQEVLRADYDLVERNLLKSFALQNSQKVKDYSNIGANQITKHTESHLGMIFLYYNNRDHSQKLQESVTLTKYDNLEIQPPYYNSTQFDVEVPPQDDRLVLFKIVDERASYAFASSTQSRAVDASDEEIEQSRQRPFGTTTYHDDPEDKDAASRDNSFYDDFIRENKDVDPGLNNETIANMLTSKIKPNPIQHPNAPLSAAVQGSSDQQQMFELEQARQANVRGTIGIDIQQGTTLPPNRGSANANKPPAVSGVFDLRLWGNFPSYVTDDSRLGAYSIFTFEKAFAEAVGPIIKSFSVDLIFLLLMVGVTGLMLLTSLLRPMFVDMVLMTSMAALVISRFSVFKVFQEVNIGLRTYPLLWAISCVFDFYWFYTYSTVWRYGDITDSGIMAGMKGFVIFLSIIHFFTKGTFTILLWWKVIVALKDKR